MPKRPDSIAPEVRKRLIVETVNQNGNISVSNLIRRFSISTATARNDLRELENEGLLKRTHGGAISTQDVSEVDTSTENDDAFITERRAVALSAVPFMQPGDVIAIDSGSIAFEFCKLLTNIQNITVVTNDIQIAAYLERNTNVSIIIAGGMLYHSQHCTVGQSAIDVLKSLYVDKVFITADGIDFYRGLSTVSMELAGIKSCLIDSGGKVILLCDHSMLGKKSFAFFSSLSSVDVLITDSNVTPEIREALSHTNLEIIYAKPVES